MPQKNTATVVFVNREIKAEMLGQPRIIGKTGISSPSGQWACPFSWEKKCGLGSAPEQITSDCLWSSQELWKSTTSTSAQIGKEPLGGYYN